MKKILVFAAVISAFSFASCKKERTCTCTSTSTTTTTSMWQTTGNTTTETSSGSGTGAIIYNDAKKKDAKKACIDFNSTDTDGDFDDLGVNPANGNVEYYDWTSKTENTTTCDLK
jgi:hypothetical protein